ncbi:hypothetical protein B7463_g629, partial [Scytalidium lignicola]
MRESRGGQRKNNRKRLKQEQRRWFVRLQDGTPLAQTKGVLGGAQGWAIVGGSARTRATKVRRNIVINRTLRQTRDLSGKPQRIGPQDSAKRQKRRTGTSLEESSTAAPGQKLQLGFAQSHCGNTGSHCSAALTG